MAWSFGHSLIVILAVVLGLAAGWLLRGLRAARTTGPSGVDGEAAAGTAVLAAPAPAATVDADPAPATIDPAPTAVADPPVDTVTGPAPTDTDAAPVPATATDVDPADMALTDDPDPAPVVAPRAAPDAERTEPAGDADGSAEPGAADKPVAPVEPVPADQPTEPAAPVAADSPVANEKATARDEPATADEPVAAEEPVAVATPTPRPAVATPPVRPVAAAAVEVDDFRRIQGVGPKMAAALQAAGVRTYRQLAELDEAGLREVIRGAGLRAAPGLATWPQQAKVLAGASDEVTSALSTGGSDPA